MKNIIFTIVFIVFLFVKTYTVYAVANAPAGYTLVASTHALELYFNERTAGICVFHIENGQLWFSNPQNINEDNIATGINISRLRSQIELTYVNPRGQVGRYNSYDFSVSSGNFSHEIIENGIRVVYNFGDETRDINFLPPYISEERFRTLILDQLPDRVDQQRIRDLYFFDSDAGVFLRTGQQMSEMIMYRVFEILDRIGYTEEEMEYDRQYFGGAEINERRPRFQNVAISYEIVGDMFYATLHAGEIVEPEGFPIISINILEFFGAADMYSEGYIFIPDGSGALIELNNGRTFAQPFSAPVYGRDRAIVLFEDILTSETVRLPVFGMNKDGNGFLAIIEEGAAVAHINADISGRTNGFNSVFAGILVRASDTLNLSDGTTIRSATIFPNDHFASDVRIAYHFLYGNRSSYVGMANFYRRYLADKYSLQPVSNEDIPFYVEFVGGFQRRTSFLGIPITRFTPMTTFNQAQNITESFMDSGISNINVLMSGWFNGGVRHSLPTRINVAGGLGGRNGLTALNNFLTERGAALYPVVNIMTNYRRGLFYNDRRMSSRQINQRPAFNTITYVPTYLENTFPRSAVISPRNILGIVERFLSVYASLNIRGVALSDMGTYVQSDFYNNNMYGRDDSMQVIVDGISKISNEHQILVRGGNAPSIAYADHIVNVPFSHSAFNITNRSVPFMQIALRSYVDFAGEPINLWDVRNLETAFLKILEYNSGVHFKLTHDRSSITKRTEFEYLFSTHYADWFDVAVDIYTRANYELRNVRHSAVVDRTWPADGVIRVSYENGVSFTINYNLEPVNVIGREIPGLSFIREDG